jgi:hypothetical protein
MRLLTLNGSEVLLISYGTIMSATWVIAAGCPGYSFNPQTISNWRSFG